MTTAKQENARHLSQQDAAEIRTLNVMLGDLLDLRSDRAAEPDCNLDVYHDLLMEMRGDVAAGRGGGGDSDGGNHRRQMRYYIAQQMERAKRGDEVSPEVNDALLDVEDLYRELRDGSMPSLGGR